MSEKPILFSGEMVRAILDGRETMTRRVINPQPEVYPNGAYSWEMGGRKRRIPNGPRGVTGGSVKYISETISKYCPYGRPGDLLYVRETWAAIWPDVDPVPLEQCEIQYRADNPDAAYPGRWPEEEAKGNPDAPKWRPSRHMPRWASRIKLRVTAVRVERVQDISEEDALSEGTDMESDYASLCINIQDALPGYPGAGSDLPRGSAALAVFAKLWDSINAKRGYSWGSNPWVFVVEFAIESIGK